MTSKRLKVFFDGGCRPNPGPIEIAVVARGHVRVFDHLGLGSNGDAEWRALIEAYRVAVSRTDGPFDLIGDSAHVVACANHATRCRSGADRVHLSAFEAESRARPAARIRWIARTQNLAGIALEGRRR